MRCRNGRYVTSTDDELADVNIQKADAQKKDNAEDQSEYAITPKATQVLSTLLTEVGREARPVRAVAQLVGSINILPKRPSRKI